MASSGTESIELRETAVELTNNGLQIEDDMVPEAGNTALSPSDVKEWSTDELEKYLDSKIEAGGTMYLFTTYHNLASKMCQLF